jgi:hypothetical protein
MENVHVNKNICIFSGYNKHSKSDGSSIINSEVSNGNNL